MATVDTLIYNSGYPGQFSISTAGNQLGISQPYIAANHTSQVVPAQTIAVPQITWQGGGSLHTYVQLTTTTLTSLLPTLTNSWNSYTLHSITCTGGTAANLLKLLPSGGFGGFDVMAAVPSLGTTMLNNMIITGSELGINFLGAQLTSAATVNVFLRYDQINLDKNLLANNT